MSRKRSKKELAAIHAKKKQPCPGSKIRSKGQGRGLGTGQGQGPIGRQNEPYKHGNYTLHTREVTFKSGHTQRIYFFCTTGKKPKSGVPCSKPLGYTTGVNKRTGLPYLKKGN